MKKGLYVTIMDNLCTSENETMSTFKGTYLLLQKTYHIFARICVVNSKTPQTQSQCRNKQALMAHEIKITSEVAFAKTER